MIVSLGLAAFCASAQSIVGYEYWVDEDHDNRVTVNLPPSADLNVTISPDYLGLAVGYHDLHLRMKQVVSGNTLWSSVASRRFWNYAGGPWAIIAVRYWTDASSDPSDMQYKYFDAPQTELNYQSFLEACDLQTTNNRLFLQLLDNNGQWSVITTKTLNVSAVTVPPTPTAISASASLCAGDTVAFNGTPGGVVVPAAIPTDFEWELMSGADWALLGFDSLTAQLVIGTGPAQIRFRGSNLCSTGSWYTGSFSPVPIPLQPSSITGDLTACEGQSDLSYSVTAVPGITYEWSVTGGWSDSGTGLPFPTTAGASNATISITPFNACGDAGPADTATIVVTAAPLQPEIVGALDFCQGDSSLLSITAIGGETYAWTTGSTTNATWVSEAGPVGVTASTGPECPNESATAEVEVPDLTLSAITGPISVLINETVSFSVPGITDASGYIWEPLPAGLEWGVDPDMNDEVAILNVIGPVGVNTVCVHAIGGDGCIGDSVCMPINIDGTVGSTEFTSSDPSMALFPNPTSGLAYLYTGVASGQLNIQVTDALGQLVDVKPVALPTDAVTLNFTDVVPGVYFVLISDEFRSEARRLVVQ